MGHGEEPYRSGMKHTQKILRGKRSLCCELILEGQRLYPTFMLTLYLCPCTQSEVMPPGRVSHVSVRALSLTQIRLYTLTCET